VHSRPEYLVLSMLACTWPACTEPSSFEEPSPEGTDGSGGDEPAWEESSSTDDELGALWLGPRPIDGGFDTGPWPSLAERPCPNDSFLSWENFGGPFMLDYCTGCHGSGLELEDRQGATLGLDFNDVGAVRAHAERIWIRSADQNASMPPFAPPERDLRWWLGEWLACGAPTEADLE